MKHEKIFGSSGIRAKVNHELLKLTFNVGLSIGGSSYRVLVGYDTRTSNEALKHTLIGGLLASGSRVFDAGIVPTPTLAYATRNFDAGAMITASHNPPEYNGIKLWNPDGSAFSAAQRNNIETAISKGHHEAAPWDKMGKCAAYDGAIIDHVERILQDFKGMHNIRVVVDCGCGAASLVTPYLLQRLGCEVLGINCHPSGFFPRDGEPNSNSLAELMSVVKITKADIGIAHDGDGDRMMVVDDQGRFIPGDKLAVILAHGLQVSKVVTTVDTSMAIDEAGFEVIRTKVGDPFVSEELKERGWGFGGEPSGAWIFPQISLCPDGVYAAAQAVKIASETKFSSLADDILDYPILRGSVPGGVQLMPQIEARLIATADGLDLTTVDGIRLSSDNGWLMIRPSGTEPKIRITAEARTQRRAKELFDLGIQATKEVT